MRPPILLGGEYLANGERRVAKHYVEHILGAWCYAGVARELTF
jgi:hypothetical protein